MYYKGKRAGWLKHIDFMLLDVLILELSYFVAFFVRHDFLPKEAESLPDVYAQVTLVLLLFNFIEAACTNNYKNILKRSFFEECVSTIKHTGIIMIGLVLYLFLSKHSFEYSRIVYILTFVFATVATLIVRQFWKLCFKKIFVKFSRDRRSMIVVTTFDEVNNTIEALKKNLDTMNAITGIAIVDKSMVGEKILDIEVVASDEDIMDYLCREWVDDVLVDLPIEYDYRSQEIIKDCIVMGVTVHKRIMRKFDTPGCVQVVQKMGQFTVLSSSVNLVTFSQVFIKRAMDIVGGLVGLIFTGILFIFVAPAIYIKSPGPIFFKQWRVGRNGKKFQIYKFRSMYMDAEERKAELMAQNKIKDGMMFKMENDPRIIGGENGKGIGNFIRNTSIDEFPQFLNVLKGDMSLVGTRPPTVDEWEKYKYHHRKRMSIKPGLTGMWQVSGRSDITDFEEVVRLDTEYISTWSIGKDIMIMLKTVKVILFRKGSY